MKQITDDYIIGFDIGTNSTGWVAMDKKNNILRVHGKNTIGVRKFREGKTAADRRSFRATRRRLKRRKWRLKFLDEIFDEEIAKIDPNFYARLKDSIKSPLDSSKKFSTQIFTTKKEEREYNKKYPTIYHLRQALMTEDRQFDIREVYLAIHHIVKYRGNFLQDTPVENFNVNKINIKESLEFLNEQFYEISPDDPILLNLENTNEIEKLLLDKTMKKADKAKKITSLLAAEGKNREQNKLFKDVAKQVTNALLGYKVNFDTIFNKQLDKDEKKPWQFKLNEVDTDIKLDNLIEQLDENEQNILNEINKMFSSVVLTTLVDPGKTLSETMIRKYKDHKKDLQLLKKIINRNSGTERADNLQFAYDLYINNDRNNVLPARKKFSVKTGSLSKDDFYKIVKKNLDDSKEAKKILREIELDTFMPFQRNNENGVIPFQLNQIELDKIIENQGKYYPFLKDLNPIKEHSKQAKYKLDELVRFRVPYYIGPMITAEDQKKTSGANFAWMIRNEQGAINPWNFNEKVDRVATANKFIKRMTTKDTYLFGEDVLPAHSLIYQEYAVLNELNNIRVNHHKLSTEQKLDLINNVFKKHSAVSTKQVENQLKVDFNLMTVHIDGLSDPKKFKNSLSTYYKYSKIPGLKEKLDDKRYLKDFENIIEWSTVFEDRAIFLEKLKEIEWLDDKQRKALANTRFQGWGRLSKKLLTSLTDNEGQNILQNLLNGQNNFMQIVTKPEFKGQIDKANEKIFHSENLDDILADAYTSPAIKKATRQVVKLADDIVKAMGNTVPAQIDIETTREAESHPRLTKTRGNRLKKLYDETATDLVESTLKEELENAISNKQLAKEKIYLYFLQGGRDAYTGEKINIDDLSSRYDVDHILPQSFIKDDSINNKVLIKRETNAKKSNQMSAKDFANNIVKDRGIKVRDLWNEWQKEGLISKNKFYNLLTDISHLSAHTKQGFINRQLVETSQINKLVTTILQSRFPNTEIISIKSSYNHDLREKYNLYKNREVNDYHHAIDAYLTAINANFLYQTYPNLRPYFVYGKFKKFSQNSEAEKDVQNSIKRFNFIYPLLDSKHENKLTVNNTDKVIFDRQKDIIDKLKRAYNFKYITVTNETYINNGQLFGMTVFPGKTKDTAKNRKLIPKKQGFDTQIYGGYANRKNAFMCLIKINGKSKPKYQVIGIPVMLWNKLKNVKSKANYEKILSKYISSEGISNFEILEPKMPYNQLIIDGDKKFNVGSASTVYNAKQLVLSEENMRIITDHFKDGEDKKQSYIKVYEEILEKMDKYLSIFDRSQYRQKLHNKHEQFKTLEPKEMKNVIKGILSGLHNDGGRSDLKEIGINRFGYISYPKGISLSENAKLIFLSPSGLFQKIIKIKNI